MYQHKYYHDGNLTENNNNTDVCKIFNFIWLSLSISYSNMGRLNINTKKSDSKHQQRHNQCDIFI